MLPFRINKLTETRFRSSPPKWHFHFASRTLKWFRASHLLRFNRRNDWATGDESDTAWKLIGKQIVANNTNVYHHLITCTLLVRFSLKFIHFILSCFFQRLYLSRPPVCEKVTLDTVPLMPFILPGLYFPYLLASLSSAEAPSVGGRRKTRKMKNRGSSVPPALSFRFSPGSARLLFTSPQFPARTKKYRGLCGGESARIAMLRSVKRKRAKINP